MCLFTAGRSDTTDGGLFTDTSTDVTMIDNSGNDDRDENREPTAFRD